MEKKIIQHPTEVTSTSPGNPHGLKWQKGNPPPQKHKRTFPFTALKQGPMTWISTIVAIFRPLAGNSEGCVLDLPPKKKNAEHAVETADGGLQELRQRSDAHMAHLETLQSRAAARRRSGRVAREAGAFTRKKASGAT